MITKQLKPRKGLFHLTEADGNSFNPTHHPGTGVPERTPDLTSPSWGSQGNKKSCFPGFFVGATLGGCFAM
jgi:hypothetical protein